LKMGCKLTAVAYHENYCPECIIFFSALLF